MNIPSKILTQLWLLIYGVGAIFGIYLGGIWASLGIVGGALLFLGSWAIQRGAPPLSMPIIYYIFGVLAVLGLLNISATHAAVSWHALLQQATIMLPLALLFSARVRAYINAPQLLRITTMAVAASAALFALECLAGAPILHILKGQLADFTEYNRGISYLAVFSFPLMGYLWVSGKRRECVGFIALMLIPVLLTESRATRLAFFGGLAVTAIAHYLPKLTQRSLSGMLCALITLPFLVTAVFLQHPQWIETLPPSWHHRVEIWDYMSYRIFDKPWLGWGLGSSYMLPFAQPHGEMYKMVTQAAGHPHNVILQLWVECGIVGVAIGIITALLVLRKASHLPHNVVPFAYGAWIAALCICSVAYSFWDDSLFALFAMTMLVFIILPKSTALK
jgi:O-antigen ligase